MYKNIKLIFMLLLFLILLYSPVENLKAEESISGNEAHMEDGIITYKNVSDTTAVYPITWRTEGFIVKNKKTKGNPLIGPRGEFWLKDGESTSKPLPDGKTAVTFVFKQEIVEKQFKKADINKKSLDKNGGFIYLNAIIGIYTNGKANNENYRTLDGIMKARGWRNPDDFRDRFDIAVEYLPAKKPVKIKFMETNDNYKTFIKTVDYDDEAVSSKFSTNGTLIPQTIESTKTGRKYKLYRVHWSELSDPVNKTDSGNLRKAHDTRTTTVNPTINYEAYVSDLDRLRKREFTVPAGGLEIVAVYKWFEEKTEAPKTMSLDILEPNPIGKILADDKGNEKFDAEQGIPTSENLYVNVIKTKDYLVSYKFRNYSGTNYYDQQVIVPGQDFPSTISVPRDYSYWKIEEFSFYELAEAEVKNYALPGGAITLKPSAAYKKPTIECEQYNSNMQEPASGFTVGQIKVRNDKIIINGITVMDGNWNTASTVKPSNPPLAQDIGENVFFKNNLRIDNTKENGEFETSGKVKYKKIVGIPNRFKPEIFFNIEEINNVIIHTPTVCKGSISDERRYNQMIEPNRAISGLVLDRNFTMQLSTTELHNEYLGYGYKDYSKYISSRRVQFPFDVYQGNNYIPAGTWMNVSGSAQYYLPTWVKEGVYTVHFQTEAINAANGINQKEENGNFNYENYVATDSVMVQISGRVYGLNIYDISDYPTWKNVFRKPNSLKLSGFNYGVGTKDQNGVTTSRNTKYTIPLVNGSHPKLKNVGVLKTGYMTRFSLITIGNMYTEKDYINIKPTFYYVDLNGKNKKEVDLYYSETIAGKKSHLVKMGSDKDKNNKKAIKMGDTYLSVPDQEIKDTAKILGVSEKTMKAAKKNVYTFTNIMIPSTLRTFVGSQVNTPSGVSTSKIAKSKQKWYCQYYLPAEIHAVPKGTDVLSYAKKKGITYKENFWLKKGYIIVNFEIETIKDGERHLTYINSINESDGYCNMWKMEGQATAKIDYKKNQFSFKNGDYILYYTDKSVKDDYISGGTH